MGATVTNVMLTLWLSYFSMVTTSTTRLLPSLLRGRGTITKSSAAGSCTSGGNSKVITSPSIKKTVVVKMKVKEVIPPVMAGL